MNFSTWPDPPLIDDLVPPEIPHTFTIFNQSYVIINNQPFLNNKNQDSDIDDNHIQDLNTNIDKKYKQQSKFFMDKHKIDRIYIQQNITSSYNLFKSIIKGIKNNEDVTNNTIQLTKLHRNMNSYFNGCRVDEAKLIIKKERNEFNKFKNEVKKQIDDIMKCKKNDVK